MFYVNAYLIKVFTFATYKSHTKEHTISEKRITAKRNEEEECGNF